VSNVKKPYEKPEIEITAFDIEDTITSSGGEIIDR